MKTMSKTSREMKARAIRRMVKAAFGFGKYTVSPWNIRVEAEGTYAFYLMGDSGVTFDDMVKVSETFKTKKIDVTGEYDDGGCPTCGGTMEYSLEIRGATVE